MKKSGAITKAFSGLGRKAARIGGVAAFALAAQGCEIHFEEGGRSQRRPVSGGYVATPPAPPVDTYEVDCYAGTDYNGDYYDVYECVSGDDLFYDAETHTNVVTLRGSTVSETSASQCVTYRAVPGDFCY